MSLSFVLWTLVGMVFLGATLGTAVKMWFYGIRDLMLLMSPVLVIALVVGLPLFIMNMVLFHPEQIDRRRDTGSANKKVLIADMKPVRRFWFAVVLSLHMFEHYPTVVGAAAYLLAAVLEGRKVSRKKREEMVSAVLELAFA
jgi:hypothetical protein